ncbi:hypothetical protein [Ancylobacter pratisalsi]|uniref:O-antigen ligase family protein n=1 Tax=Ancylobacter pratisalsi TaxID=1745854 RepID=A0A6P1YPN5_9HYPH|nr:hypothetical protein [Ancylobacter pratisalsi]QIB35437.1 hypothetical protein G3A50_18270 [Ancylobacter pratisalsi]
MSAAGGRAREAVVSLPRSFSPMPAVISNERFPGLMTTFILVATLPLFAQTFYYLNELPVPYLLSKAWPILVVPFSVYGLVWLRLPGKTAFMLFFAYTLGFNPFISMVNLGNGITDALLTTVKIWPLTYYFALSGMLVWVAPSYRRTRAVLIGLGVATFAIMLLLWLVVPLSWYVNNPELGKLFMIEEERGYRIYMPMFFGALLLFFLTRSFMRRPHWLPAVGVAIGFVLLLTIFKQRTSIGAMFLVCGYIIVTSMAPQRRLVAIGLFLAIVPLGIGYLAVENAQNLAQSLGGSLTVRQTSLGLAANFLGDNPWRWLFGVGGTTRFGSVTLADIFGNTQFYIADIGWFGVIFEYGLVGAALLAMLYGWGLYLVLKATRGVDDPIVLALSDYIVFMLVTSAVYSLVFTPGEFAISMALAVYLSREIGRPESVARPVHRIRFMAPFSRSARDHSRT